MSKPKHFLPDKIIGTKNEPVTFDVTDRDAIIYALGIGFSQGMPSSNIDPLK